jgi:hypothetical protein
MWSNPMVAMELLRVLRLEAARDLETAKLARAARPTRVRRILVGRIFAPLVHALREPVAGEPSGDPLVAASVDRSAV